MTGSEAEYERASIEQSLNEKLEAVEGWPHAFGFGHGVDVWGLFCAWVERELIPHERRLGAKIRYDVKMRPAGERPRIVVTAIEPVSGSEDNPPATK